MMNAGEIRKMLSVGESERMGFIAGDATPEVVARTVCALLNSGGGRLIIGVDEAGRPDALVNAASLAVELPARLSRLITPSALWTVGSFDMDGHEVLVVEVPEGLDKPYVVDGAIHVRRGSAVVPATREEIGALIGIRALTAHRWERRPVVNANLGDLESVMIVETAEMAIGAGRFPGDRDDVEAFLHAFGLAEHGAITNAALLLFGKQPTRWLPQARVRLLALPAGKTGDRYSVDRLFEGNLVALARQLESGVAPHLVGAQSRFTSDRWQREDRPSFPQAALREGIMNALVHRDYDSNGMITIEIHPDSLRVWNPGALPSELKPSDLKRTHPSIPRNPDIAHICYLRGLIEKVGRGTQRILEACRGARLREPKWESAGTGTTLIFGGPSESTGRGTPEELSERQLRIVAMLESHGAMKAPQVEALLGEDVSDRTIRNDLGSLVSLGVLVRRGRGPNTTYAKGGDDAET